MIISLISLNVMFTASAQTTSLAFTPEEVDYIKNTKSIKMWADPNWAPFEQITSDARHEGIAADLIQLAAVRL